jgi:polyphosphate glucokinase
MSGRNHEPSKQPRRASSGRSGPHTLGIDIGGTALKASVLDSAGRMIVERVRMPTPYPCTPKIMLDALAKLVAPLPASERISVGFPGVIRDGRAVTAPHFSKRPWRDYPLESAIAERFARPARLLNDAEVQALGIITGEGLEVVLTLGTGVGSAVLRDGWLAPHLELAQHPLHAGKTYNEYVGRQALRRHGTKKWTKRVLEMIGVVDSLFHYDVLYLGGGNAQYLQGALPRNVRTASNDTGITGGIHLWDESVWEAIRGPHRCWAGTGFSLEGRSSRPRSPALTEPASKSP